MTATFTFTEWNSSTSTTTATNFNLGSTNSANLNPSTYPITAGTSSYEKWLTAAFAGSFTSIDNLQFWKSTGTYVTGEAINWTSRYTTYTNPTTTDSVIATTAVPTADPTTANVSIGDSLTGSLTAAGESDYIILQASITTAASAGSANQLTFTLEYDET